MDGYQTAEGSEGDITVTCVECRTPWVWTQDNQQYFAVHGLRQPRRCSACSRARRERLQPQQEYADGR